MNESIIKYRKNKSISLEIIIPVYNEEGVLDLLIKRLSDVFSVEQLKINNIKSVNYLFIDDGSQDKSADIIQSYIKEGLNSTLYRFSRNFGHQNAVSAGLDKSAADVVVVIDADLQDPPEVIYKMVERWRNGYDIVYGERKKRKENIFKRISFWSFYRILNYLSEVNIPLDSGDFSLMDRNAVNTICNLSEKIRYPRVMRAWIGFNQTGVSYERDFRKAGVTKYKLSSYYKLATDGITSASIRPLKISQLLSFIYLIFIIILLIVIVVKYLNYFFVDYELRTLSDEMALWFLFSFALITFGGFIQALLFHIISAYVGRGYLESKGRPPYIIMEIINKKTYF